MGVAVGDYVCMLLETEVTVDQQKIFDFSTEGALGFPGSLQVTERATFTRENVKHPELDPLGIGFDRILKFARVAKIFEKNIGGANLHPPPPLFAG